MGNNIITVLKKDNAIFFITISAEYSKNLKKN